MNADVINWLTVRDGLSTGREGFFVKRGGRKLNCFETCWL